MGKLFFNSRDELVFIDFNDVALVQADGNYCKLMFIDRREMPLSIGINKLSDIISQIRFEKALFVKIGRSLLINQSFLERIDMLKQQIILADKGVQPIRITAPKQVLKDYKTFLAEKYRMKPQENQ